MSDPVARVVEIRDVNDSDRIRERCAYRGDVRHGRRETFYFNGKVHQRWHYVDGVEHGRYEELFGDGSPELAGDFAHGRAHGRWTCHRGDGSISVEVDFDHGATMEGRILLVNGSVLAPGPIEDPRDILAWRGLADSWHEMLVGRSDTGDIQACVQNWPDGAKHHPLQWIRARIDAGERPTGNWMGWSDVLLERDEDPRLDWIDGLSLDHTDMYEDQLPRVLKRSRQLERLEIVEGTVKPSFAALMRPPADWSSLASLTLDDYYPDDPLVALADLELPALRELVLRNLSIRIRHEPHAPNGIAHTVLALARAPFWPQLRRLEIEDVTTDATLIALARHPMQNLEELRLVSYVDGEECEVPEAVLAAWYDPTLRPKLRRS